MADETQKVVKIQKIIKQLLYFSDLVINFREIRHFFSILYFDDFIIKILMILTLKKCPQSMNFSFNEQIIKPSIKCH